MKRDLEGVDEFLWYKGNFEAEKEIKRFERNLEGEEEFGR